MNRARRARIVATLGPASRAPGTVKALAQAGVDVFRLNFSHGSHDDHAAALKAVRGIVGQMPLLTYKSFVLFYYYDMSVAAIAANLTINENNVKTRLWRARNAVRKGLKGVLL